MRLLGRAKFRKLSNGALTYGSQTEWCRDYAPYLEYPEPDLIS